MKEISKTLQLYHKNYCFLKIFSVYQTLASGDFLLCFLMRRWWRSRQCCHLISTENISGSHSWVILHSKLYENNYKVIVKYIINNSLQSHYSRKSQFLIDHSCDNCHRSFKGKYGNRGNANPMHSKIALTTGINISTDGVFRENVPVKR